LIEIALQTTSPLDKVSSVFTLQKVRITKDDFDRYESDYLWGYTIKYFLLFFWAIPWSVVMGFISEFSVVFWGFMQFYYVILFLFFLTTKDYYTLFFTYLITGVYFIYTLPARNIRATYMNYHQIIAFAIANFIIAFFLLTNKQLQIYKTISNATKFKPEATNFRQQILRRMLTCLIASIILASILGIYTYIAAKPVSASKDYEVEFINKSLEKVVRNQLNYDDKQTIMRKDLDNIQGMIISNKAVTFSNKYEYDSSKWSENNLLFNFDALETIADDPNGFENEITTIKDIKHFRKLKYLQITVDGKLALYNLDDLQCLEELETLKINFKNHTTNISNLCNVKSLKYVSFNKSKITNLDFIKNLENLETLRLTDTKNLEDTSALSECPSLKNLAMDNCNISDDFTSSISDIKELKYLSLNNNTITHLNFTKDLAHLEFLDVHCNMISDIKELANNKELKYLLLLKNNNITDISPLFDLTNLKCIWLEEDKKKDTQKIKSKDVQIYTGI